MNKKLLRINYVLICMLIIAIIVLIYVLNIENKRTTYNEFTYYDFKISYNDDNCWYEIFTDDKTYTIDKSKLDVRYDTETYIIIYDNNYDWYYNKAILSIGVKR